MNKQREVRKGDVKNELHYFNGNYCHSAGETTPSQQLLQSLAKWSGQEGAQLAKMIGMGVSTYYKILDGTIRDPRMETFHKILSCYSRYYLLNARND